MVIHIAMKLAAGISPSRSPPRLACAPVPAVLSARAHSVRDSNWRNRGVARAKSLAETAETSKTSQTAKTAQFRAFREPRKRRHRPGANLRNLPVWFAWPDKTKILRSIRYERIILRGVLAVQSHEAEGPAGPKIRGGNPMSMVRLAAAAALAVSVALPAAAQGIPKAQSPEEVGFLASRLKRLSDRIEEGDRKSTRLNSSHAGLSRMPSSA